LCSEVKTKVQDLVVQFYRLLDHGKHSRSTGSGPSSNLVRVKMKVKVEALLKDSKWTIRPPNKKV
jgi:hypothetical protein